jgi:hypothetical protein
MQIGSRGIPHLAKNERDMGHPLIRGRDRNLDRQVLTQTIKPNFLLGFCGTTKVVS